MKITIQKYVKRKSKNRKMATSGVAKRRLLKEFAALEKEGYAPEMDDDDISSWKLQLPFKPESDIGKQLAARGEKGNSDKFIVGFKFEANYPMSPPFFYVESPRITSKLPIAIVYATFEECAFRSTGGTWGFFQGVPCWHLLTNAGWTPACTTKTVLVQFQAMLNEAADNGIKIDMSSAIYTTPEEGRKYIKDAHPEWS